MNHILCVCVCVCARARACEREGGRETARERESESYMLLEDSYGALAWKKITHHFRRRGPGKGDLNRLKLLNLLLLRSIPFHVPSGFCFPAPWCFQSMCLLLTLFQCLCACLRASSRDVIRRLHPCGRFKERIAVSPRRRI